MRRQSTGDVGRDVLAVLELPGSTPAGHDELRALGGRAAPPIAGSAAFRPAGGFPSSAPAADTDELERTAAMVLSAMEAGAKVPDLGAADRRLRRTGRVACRVRAQLCLWADGENGEAWVLFTRDIDARAMGFICRDNLPMGYGGTLSFLSPSRRREQIDVTVTRCRPCSAGWYEGALHFNQPQPWLVEEFAARNA